MKIPKIAMLIVAVYAIVIIGSLIYFVYMQHFGSRGLEFQISGSDYTFTLFDGLIIILLPIALVLFAISIMAFFRKPNMRLFLISTTFFFFVIREVLFILENFFPKEFIFIQNAERALEFLILISFIFLLYRK